jgi:hypothetical protein
MRLMGHSTVTVSQKYVHPSPETVETAFERSQALNKRSRCEVVLLSVFPNGIPDDQDR